MPCASSDRLASGSSPRLPTCSNTVERVTIPPSPNGWNVSYTRSASSHGSALAVRTRSQKASRESPRRHAVSTSR